MKKLILILVLIISVNASAVLEKTIEDINTTITLSYTANTTKMNDVLNGLAEYIYRYLQGSQDFDSLSNLKKAQVIDSFF